MTGEKCPLDRAYNGADVVEAFILTHETVKRLEPKVDRLWEMRSYVMGAVGVLIVLGIGDFVAILIRG